VACVSLLMDHLEDFNTSSHHLLLKQREERAAKWDGRVSDSSTSPVVDHAHWPVTFDNGAHHGVCTHVRSPQVYRRIEVVH
jgi:hypothetical protein